MKNKSLIVLLSSLIIIFVGIYLADLLGFWNTTSSSDFTIIDEETQKEVLSIDEIRGSTSFEELESFFGVPAVQLATAFNFNTNTPELLKAMDVSEAYDYLGEDVEMGTGSVRMFIYMYTGTSMAGLEEIENIPSTAKEVLENEGKWTEELEEMMTGYIVVIDRPPFDTEALSLAKEDHEDETNPGATLEIKGSTTIQNLLDAGISIEDIEAELGTEVKNNNLGFKDLCEQNNISFSDAKQNILLLLEE